MLKRRKIEPTLKERIQKLPEEALIGKISKIIIRQLSERERDEFREKAIMALVLEIQQQDMTYRSLYDEHIELMTENEMLRKKLKISISKSKTQNKK